MIGVFDSGLGGLSVVREVLRLDPSMSILYVGDREWAPYGQRTLEAIRQRSELVTDHLLDQGAESIVIACNTASAAALHHLRARHPGTNFVGMEPAVKPAAGLTRSGKIGVLATPATFQGELYASVVDRYATDVEVLAAPCPGWVELVEEATPSVVITATIEQSIRPVLDGGADVLVLGCTHYPFLRDHIQRIAGPEIIIVDPGEAVARQIIRTAAPSTEPGFVVQVTGDPGAVAGRIRALTGLAPAVEAVTFSHRVVH